MKQALDTPPKTKAEEKCRKGPPPLIAFFLAAGLCLAFLLFFGPALVGSITEGGF